jgi:ABC-type amino acid transport substrate-binding protein
MARIKDKKELQVAVEQAFGRSIYRFLESSPSGSRDQDHYYSRLLRGIEPELAYEIADSLCDQLFQSKNSLESGHQNFKCTFWRDRPPLDERKYCKNGCKSIKINVRFAPMEWMTLLKSWKKGKFDIALSNITYVEDRILKYDMNFTERNYGLARYALLLRAKNPKYFEYHLNYQRKNSTNLPRPLRINVEKGTTSADCTNELLKKYAEGQKRSNQDKSHSPFEVIWSEKSNQELALYLLSGTVDGVMSDQSHAEGVAKKRPTLDCVILPEDFFMSANKYCKIQEYRAVLRDGDNSIKAIIDNILGDTKTMHGIYASATDQFHEYLKKYPGANPDKTCMTPEQFNAAAH